MVNDDKVSIRTQNDDVRYEMARNITRLEETYIFFFVDEMKNVIKVLDEMQLELCQISFSLFICYMDYDQKITFFRENFE